MGPVREKRSPQLAAWPATVSWVDEAFKKIDPSSGGAEGSTLDVFSALHDVGGAMTTWLVSDEV